MGTTPENGSLLEAFHPNRMGRHTGFETPYFAVPELHAKSGAGLPAAAKSIRAHAIPTMHVTHDIPRMPSVDRNAERRWALDVLAGLLGVAAIAAFVTIGGLSGGLGVAIGSGLLGCAVVMATYFFSKRF